MLSIDTRPENEDGLISKNGIEIQMISLLTRIFGKCGQSVMGRELKKVVHFLSRSTFEIESCPFRPT